MVTELARHCSLDDFLEDVHTRPDRWNGQMPVTLKREASAQIAAGMAHMHAQGLIHRDLAARNVLVTEHDAPSGVIARWSSMVRPERASPTLLGGDGEDIMPLTHALARCGRSKSAVPREI